MLCLYGTEHPNLSHGSPLEHVKARRVRASDEAATSGGLAAHQFQDSLIIIPPCQEHVPRPELPLSQPSLQPVQRDIATGIATNAANKTNPPAIMMSSMARFSTH
jgi:hypothetical protein